MFVALAGTRRVTLDRNVAGAANVHGPVPTFAEASEWAMGAVEPLVVELSPVYGWVAIWRREGERFVLMAESADSALMRYR